MLAATGVANAEAVRKKTEKPPKRRPVEEVINPLVGPDLSTWMVGPVSWIATEDEIAQFQALTSAAAAESFVEAFWKHRDPAPKFDANPQRELFEQRLAEAEKLYREGATAGHRTDRGTVYILYGKPESVTFEVADRPGEPPIEEWRYPKDAEVGLDDREPQKLYRFFKPDELTVFYRRMPVNPRERVLRDRWRPPR